MAKAFFQKGLGHTPTCPAISGENWLSNLSLRNLRFFALNTLSPQTSANFTHWDVRDPAVENSMIFPPRQIDFISVSENLARISTARAQNSSATDSDLRPVVCSIPSPMTPEARAAKRARVKHVRQQEPKPMNWYASGPMSTHAVCDDLSIVADDDRRDIVLSERGLNTSFHCFTDGISIRGQGACWAFNIFTKGDT